MPNNLPVIGFKASRRVPAMGRYYFNIKDGETVIPDLEGDDLPNAEAAFTIIQETVSDILARPEHYGGFAPWARREFIVTDHGGREVMRCPWPHWPFHTGGSLVSDQSALLCGSGEHRRRAARRRWASDQSSRFLYSGHLIFRQSSDRPER
jgi:hypothetical protein